MKKLLALHKWPSLSLSVRQIRLFVLLFTLAACGAGLVAAAAVLHYRVQAAISVYDAEFELNARAAAARLLRQQALLQRARLALADLPAALPAVVPGNPLLQKLDSAPARAPDIQASSVAAMAQMLALAWRQSGAADAEDGNVWLAGFRPGSVYLLPQNPTLAALKLGDAAWNATLTEAVANQLRQPELLAQLAAHPGQTLLAPPLLDPFTRAPLLRLAAIVQPRNAAPVVLALDAPVARISPASPLFAQDLALVWQNGADISPAGPLSVLLQTALADAHHQPLSAQVGWRLVHGAGAGFSLLFAHALPVPGWYCVARVSAGRIWADVRGSVFWLAAACFGLMAALACWAWMIDRRILRPTEQQSWRIQESEALNQGVFQTAPVGLMLVGQAQGEVLKLNELARAIWAAAGEDARDALIRQCQQRAVSPWAGAVQFETTLPGEAGPRFLQVRLASMALAADAALLITLHDQTDTHAAEARLHQAVADTAKANRAKSEFLATMSHEIRTPLNGMLGGIELLALTRLDIEQADRLDIIRRSSAALIATLNDVLDFSKIEAGEMPVRPQPCNLVALLENTARNFAPLASAKGIALHALLDPSLPAEVNIDAGRVEQVLGNLLSNAIKFTARGRVTLAANVLPDHLEIKVLDTGLGISSSDQELLFEPFMQAEQSDTRRFEGTGLGLSICKRLMGLMGGSIHLASEPGVGSCFSVRLPFTRALEAVEPAVSLAGVTVQLALSTDPMQQEIGRWLRVSGASVLEGEAPYAGAVLVIDEPGYAIYAQTRPPQACVLLQQDAPALVSAQPGPVRFSSFARPGLMALIAQLASPTSLPGTAARSTAIQQALPFCLQILLVEDHEVNQIVMRKQLEHLGQRVDVMSNGEEALFQLSCQRYDLVITDIQMPRMDGYELARRLREQGYDVPIVAISARVFQDEIQRCAAVGIAHYLSKPLRTDQLAQLLRQVAEQRPPDHRALIAVPGPQAEATPQPAAEDLPDNAMCMALQADMHTLTAAFHEQNLALWQSRLHALSGALAVLDYPVEARHCRAMEQTATPKRLTSPEDWEELQSMLSDITLR